MSPDALYLLYLIAGLVIGGLSAWLFAKYHFASRLAGQASDFQKMQQQSQATFENLANRILEEKTSKFTAQNQEQIHNILQPLKERIKDFEENIDRKFLDEAKDKLSLKIAIDQLRTLNAQLSDDANRLAAALKGDNKTQGDWGEYQLEMLLEKAGLEKDIHYLTQTSYKDEENREWTLSTWDFAKQIMPLLAIGVVIAGYLLGSTHDDINMPGTKVNIPGIVPNEWVAWLVGGNSFFANFSASIIGAFMYFATLTEVPILQGLINAGMGKGPALALLLAGPSLSLPNMLVIRGVIGTQKTVVYVLLVVIMATIAGLIYGSLF